jgi:hypothetical protein
MIDEKWKNWRVVSARAEVLLGESAATRRAAGTTVLLEQNGVTVMSVTLPELKESLNGSQNESTQLKIARWWFSTAAAFYK